MSKNTENNITFVGLSQEHRAQIARCFADTCDTQKQKDGILVHIRCRHEMLVESIRRVAEEMVAEQSRDREPGTIVFVTDWDRVINDIFDMIEKNLETEE